jgi:hypothetical protein
MTDSEKWLLEVLVDLRDKVETNTQYTLIKASGLLRQLFLEGDCLVDQANRNHKIKLNFVTNKGGEHGRIPIIQNGIIWEPILVVNFVDPKERRDHTVNNNLQKFLMFEIFYFEGKAYTVKEVIRLGANILGGVHFSSKKNVDELSAKRLNNMVTTADKTTAVAHSLSQIARVTIKGLEPLEKKIMEVASL